MLESSYRDTWAEISLDAIYRNVTLFKRKLEPSCKLMAVVKADGYGHGAVEVARTSMEAGADYLGVAYVDEALQLRAAGIGHPILVLGYTPPRSVEAAVKHGIAITVCSQDVLEQAVASAQRWKRTAVIHIKIDTGMSRLGVGTYEEAATLIREASRSPAVVVEGLFTHFADADNIADDAYTRKQFGQFTAFVRELLSDGLAVPPLRHCCNSAAALRFPDMHLDMVRIGIGLYGLPPYDQADEEAANPLEQALHLKSRIIALRTIAPRQPVSYGCTFRSEQERLIATIPVGYADGLSRALSNQGRVYVRGACTPIAGTICMDQTMLDVTDVPGVAEGDEVTLFGGSGPAFVSLGQVAATMRTIHYEVACLLGKRVPRLYMRHGKPVRAANALLYTESLSI
ncbi:alanine racemase [Paenibacillus allorhizosphaerae]|uniref:Alanine racemase n=1 Tax=Paenibacillus allorhizosphaerae TaxID=2849866 RepID=A0ABM8VB61_9BACL|nr:alanine racemase [Paenibacillus allorhizosphaerae]CAG7618540.1 Alanine racemase [Paenibacillus allorhizosphaerae]